MSYKEKRSCKYCSKTFEANALNQLYCSALCRRRARNERDKGHELITKKRECLSCGKEIASEERANKIYCSKECKNKKNAFSKPTSGEAVILLAEKIRPLLDKELVSEASIEFNDEVMLLDAKYLRAISSLKLNKSKGYLRANFKMTPVYIHRLIIYLETGELSTKEKPVDHINRNKLDNRACNLRLTSVSTNNRNKDSSNKTEYKGVFKSGNIYYCQAYHDGSNHHIGSGFSSPIEAALARQRYLDSLKL